MKRGFLLASVLFCIVFLSPLQVQAMDVRSGDSVTVAKDQVVNGSVFLSGTTVTMDGTVHGDVYCAGQDVSISGSVDGDVLCAAQSGVISGQVFGNVRMLGQSVGISGAVARNVTVAVQSLTISSQASVSGEVFYAGQTITVDGTIAKSLEGFTQTSKLANGKIHGPVSLQVPDKTEKPKKIVAPKNPWPASALPSIFVNLVVGLLAVSVFGKFIKRSMDVMTAQTLPTGLVGAVALMATPVAVVVLICTILGIPFAIILLMAYILAILVSRIFVAGVVGAYVLESFQVKQKANALLQMAVGVPLLWFMFKAPIVGGFVGFLAVCWGLGGLIQGFRKKI